MKKKLEHIWYYYKWYILAAALVLLVAANFVGELGQRRQPDGVVSIVTTSQVPEETVEKIRALFETLWGDRNQDGVTDVEVNVYAYDGMGYSGGSGSGRVVRFWAGVLDGRRKNAGDGRTGENLDLQQKGKRGQPLCAGSAGRKRPAGTGRLF